LGNSRNKEYDNCSVRASIESLKGQIYSNFARKNPNLQNKATKEFEIIATTPGTVAEKGKNKTSNEKLVGCFGKNRRMKTFMQDFR
jgi:hypothetical protein